MPKPRLLTSPQPLYRWQKVLVPQAGAAFNAAVAKWRKALKTERVPTEAVKPDALNRLVGVTVTAAKNGGKVAEVQLNAALQLNLRFNMVNPAAVAWSREHTARLVREVGDETKAGIQTWVESALRGERTPTQVQAELQRIVGLTERQSNAVAAHLDRLLEGGDFTLAEASASAFKYADDLLAYRAEVIARTECIRALNEGQQLLWKQGVNAGLIGDDRMEQVWLTAKDERTCEICNPLNGARAPIGGGVFVLASGVPSEFTGPTAHPSCRCSIGLAERADYDPEGA